jgi:hypothetical protein
MWCRLGESNGTAVLEAHWNKTWGGTAGDDVLAAALEEAENKASTLDLENAKLRLALVAHAPLYKRILDPFCALMFVL